MLDSRRVDWGRLGVATATIALSTTIQNSTIKTNNSTVHSLAVNTPVPSSDGIENIRMFAHTSALGVGVLLRPLEVILVTLFE